MAQVKRSRWAWFLILMFTWQGISYGAQPSGSSTEEGVLTRIISVKAKVTGSETVLTVKGNGSIPEFTWETFADPPRIVVDLPAESRGFESRSIALESPNLDKVRIGHHGDRIRLVFDVKGPLVPPFLLKKEKGSLILAVSHDERPAWREPQEPVFTEPEKRAENRVEAWAGEKSPSLPLPIEPARTEEDRRVIPDKKPLLDELLEVNHPDTEPDTLLLGHGIEAFRARRWGEATQSFRALLDKDPGGRYAERASLLLAMSCEHLHDLHVPGHFMEIRDAYETFLSRFPSSPHVPYALVALGRLCLGAGAMEEALGFYSLAFSRDKESLCAAEALAGKMKILAMKKQLDDALGAAQHILLHYPHSPEALDARVEMARILHDMGLFKESLAALSGLETGPSHTVYQRPEISLYLGYNAYRLRNYPMARENLLRFYNMSPRSEEIPLVLSRIGDTYREENLAEAAGKIYRWAVQHHPDSEGALISQIRLAEMEEQEARTASERKAGSREETGEKAPSIRETYENIIKNPVQKEAKNPLAALALMRLAVIYQKEGEYEKSLAMAKELLNRFPGQQLKKETEQILLKALQEMLSQSLRSEDYPGAIRFYYEEKDLFHKIRSPEVFLPMARAFLKVELKEDAAELFKMAGSLLPDEEKPSDLLYFLAWDLQRQDKPDQALDRLRAVTDKGKDKEYVCRAYQLKGRILVRQKQWDKALEAFASALKQPPDSCTHLEILTERAAAMAACGMKDAALKSIGQARDLTRDCANPSLSVLEDLGGVLFLLGRTDEALALLQKEVGKEENRMDQERLKWKLAQYHERLGQKESSQAVYQQLAKVEDPLWSGLANDKMEEMRFRQDMETFRKP